MRLVYFARAAGTNLIKIGASHTPAARLLQLQNGCPYTLELLGTLPGGLAIESHLHRMLVHRREHGEWYRLEHEEVLDLLGVNTSCGLPHIKEHIERTALAIS